MVKLGGQSGTVLAVAALGAAQVLAEFTNSFDGITSASSVTLSWSDVAAQNYPLCITVQVIDRGEDGFSANAYRANITSMCLRLHCCRLLAGFCSVPARGSR